MLKQLILVAASCLSHLVAANGYMPPNWWENSKGTSVESLDHWNELM